MKLSMREVDVYMSFQDAVIHRYQIHNVRSGHIYIYVSKSDLRFFIFPMLLIEVYMRFEDLFVIFTKKNNNYRRRIYVFKS